MEELYLMVDLCFFNIYMYFLSTKSNQPGGFRLFAQRQACLPCENDVYM